MHDQGGVQKRIYYNFLILAEKALQVIQNKSSLAYVTYDASVGRHNDNIQVMERFTSDVSLHIDCYCVNLR